MLDQIIRFGVLTLLGCSMLLMVPLDRLFIKKEKVSAAAGLAVSLLAFCITRNVNDGSLGFESLDLVKLPRALYQMGDVGNFLGFTEPRFYSADYFSLIPWFFLFWAGYFGYHLVIQKGAMEKAAALKPLPKLFGWVDFIGKHSLIIYMLHQPVIYGVLYLIFEL